MHLSMLSIKAATSLLDENGGLPNFTTHASPRSTTSPSDSSFVTAVAIRSRNSFRLRRLYSREHWGNELKQTRVHHPLHRRRTAFLRNSCSNTHLIYGASPGWCCCCGPSPLGITALQLFSFHCCYQMMFALEFALPLHLILHCEWWKTRYFRCKLRIPCTRQSRQSLGSFHACHLFRCRRLSRILRCT